MIDIPSRWTLTPLGNCGEWGSGGTPTRTNPQYYQNGIIPWLIIGDLNNGIVTEAATYITAEGLRSSSAKLLPIDTLLVAMYGSIGKLGITGIECATNQAIAYCKPNSGIAQLKYLFYALMNAKDALVAEGQGGTQQNINQGILKSFVIPLAPLNEQKRIAEKLDSLLSRVNSCQSYLERVPQILKRFRQSVLAAATSGRLTEGWRSSRNDGVIQADEPESDLPVGWYWAPVSKIVTNHDNKRIPVKERDRAARRGKYPYYGAFGIIDSIDDFLYDGEFLLVAEDGKNLESRDRPIALIASGQFWVNNHAHVLQNLDTILLKYLCFWFNSPSLELADYLTGIDQVKLTRGALDRILVPVPPIPEQAEIVHRVEKLFAYADRLEARYWSAVERVEQLTPSLLAKAFRGELVEQDPNDEPASVLLERIRNHRDAKK
jgi:type I restriction enzyme S subunit